MKEEKDVNVGTRSDNPGKFIPRVYDEGRLTVRYSDVYEGHCVPRQQDHRG
jgi:hypothetical protein